MQRSTDVHSPIGNSHGLSVAHSFKFSIVQRISALLADAEYACLALGDCVGTGLLEHSNGWGASGAFKPNWVEICIRKTMLISYVRRVIKMLKTFQFKFM